MRILIIEDESIIAKRTIRMTKAFLGGALTSIHHCDDIMGGILYLKNNEIDLLLLDLNLNGEDGFDVLKEIVSYSFHTIIISAYKEKAIQAFEYGVLDFVPKPYNESRLEQALSRTTLKKENPATELKYLAIQKRGSQHLIEVSDILYIQGARIYTELYLTNNKKEIHTKSLDKLADLLPASFERIHKSYIADMEKVSAMHAESGGKYTLELKDGTQLPVSRSKYKGLKEKWFK